MTTETTSRRAGIYVRISLDDPVFFRPFVPFLPEGGTERELRIPRVEEMEAPLRLLEDNGDVRSVGEPAQRPEVTVVFARIPR